MSASSSRRRSTPGLGLAPSASAPPAAAAGPGLGGADAPPRAAPGLARPARAGAAAAAVPVAAGVPREELAGGVAASSGSWEAGRGPAPLVSGEPVARPAATSAAVPALGGEGGTAGPSVAACARGCQSRRAGPRTPSAATHPNGLGLLRTCARIECAAPRRWLCGAHEGMSFRAALDDLELCGEGAWKAAGA